MRPIEFANFISKRAGKDDLAAFYCRLMRFGVIGLYLPRFNSQRFYGAEERTIIGSLMELDAKDKGVSHDLMVNGIREPYSTMLMNQVLKQGDVCVDIGANIGYYALQEARLVGDKGYVYAIEPVAESVKWLKRNIALNGYNNIEVFQLACGDNSGVGEINVSEKRNWSSIRPENKRHYVRKDEIEIVRLDSFIEGKIVPNIIRMDVEGYEYEIIKGMKGLFDLGHPMKLFIEMHFDIMREKSVELCWILKEAGFEVVVATVEPHPALMKSKLAQKVCALTERGIGAQTGFNRVSIGDLISQKKYATGQVEYMEVLFERR